MRSPTQTTDDAVGTEKKKKKKLNKMNERRPR
jgi:hypothetical protein